MIDSVLFNKERELFVENLTQGVLAMMGLNVMSFDAKGFYQMTDIALEIANYGTMDEFLAADEADFIAFIETMEIMVPAVGRNMNIEEEYPNLMSAVNCLGLYLSLFIVEDQYFSEYCEITSEAIAASLGVKLSTLKNMFSLKKLAGMDNDELRSFLESQEKFKPFKPYNSLMLDAPVDLSGINNCNSLIYAIEKRAEKYSITDELNAIYEDAKLNDDADSYMKFMSIFKPRMVISNRVRNFISKLHIKTDSLKKAISQVSEDLQSGMEFLSIELNNLTENSDSASSSDDRLKEAAYIFARPDVAYTPDHLGDYLKVEFGFSNHPDDRGKNQKMFAVQKGKISLAIERTKTPSVWMVKALAQELDPMEFEITWYDKSEDGKGRHSALHSYSEFHTAEIAKVKVKSFEQAKSLVSQLS